MGTRVGMIRLLFAIEKKPAPSGSRRGTRKPALAVRAEGTTVHLRVVPAQIDWRPYRARY